ncbi:MAG: hypothetical protein LC775_01755 [Acidobacteria bacterium]|nr:hypothetical protein [Acidobacteriota bacterium]
MSKRKRPSQRVSGQHPPFPRRPELWMALGLTALSPGAALAAFPANINLGDPRWQQRQALGRRGL